MSNINDLYPASYLRISEALLNDYKRMSARTRTEEIVGILQDKLEQNKTKTMTFTEDGLMLAIKLIKEVYGISD